MECNINYSTNEQVCLIEKYTYIKYKNNIIITFLKIVFVHLYLQLYLIAYLYKYFFKPFSYLILFLKTIQIIMNNCIF